MLVPTYASQPPCHNTICNVGDWLATVRSHVHVSRRRAECMHVDVTVVVFLSVSDCRSSTSRSGSLGGEGMHVADSFRQSLGAPGSFNATAGKSLVH
jgi:hypothetical protein